MTTVRQFIESMNSKSDEGLLAAARGEAATQQPEAPKTPEGVRIIPANTPLTTADLNDLASGAATLGPAAEKQSKQYAVGNDGRKEIGAFDSEGLSDNLEAVARGDIRIVA